MFREEEVRMWLRKQAMGKTRKHKVQGLEAGGLFSKAEGEPGWRGWRDSMLERRAVGRVQHGKPWGDTGAALRNVSLHSHKLTRDAFYARRCAGERDSRPSGGRIW